jgi:outer membrane protein assembly factor BamA
VVAELVFEGDLHLSLADQDQIAAFLKHRTYSGDADAVTSDVLERVRRAWQDHGYFDVRVSGGSRVLTSSPTSERVAVTVQIDEGQQYRLQSIRFDGNREVSDKNALRSLFSLKDGDIFSGEEIAKGLDKLRFAYRQLGFINFTSLPNTQFNEELQTISLLIDIDEGKRFYVSSVKIIGLDADVFEDSLLKRGDVYDEGLANLFIQQHAPLPLNDASFDSRIHLQLDERAATVGITYDLRSCPYKE